jgi:oligoendopeptidase F
MTHVQAVATENNAADSSPPPRWNLGDLYQGQDAPELEADLKWAREKAESFRNTYAERLATLSGAELATAIAAYEEIVERLHKVMTYAQLVFAGDMSDPETGRFMQTVQERFTDISTTTLFFVLELNRVDEDTLKCQLADPAARRYGPWVRDVRVFKPHQLDDDFEKLLHEKSVTGVSAWVRLFDQTMAEARFRRFAGPAPRPSEPGSGIASVSLP